jgi:hypothetical protein
MVACQTGLSQPLAEVGVWFHAAGCTIDEEEDEEEDSEEEPLPPHKAAAAAKPFKVGASCTAVLYAPGSKQWVGWSLLLRQCLDLHAMHTMCLVQLTSCLLSS